MKSLWRLWWIIVLLAAVPAMAVALPITYHVQLIRGTRTDKPEGKDWKPIGPKLAQRLAPFRWQRYWEVKRDKVKLEKGKVAKLQLNEERALEIEAVSATHSEIRLYRDGNLVRTAKQALDSPITILGGDREGGESWFVVVRLDAPDEK